MKRNAFVRSTYERELSSALAKMERSGAFAPIKAVMKRHLAKTEWKKLFLELHFVSVPIRASHRRVSRQSPRQLAALESYCGINAPGLKPPASRTLAPSERRRFIKALEAAERAAAARKTRGVIFSSKS